MNKRSDSRLGMPGRSITLLALLILVSTCFAEIGLTETAPTITRQGTHGLINTFSAEHLGAGRLTFMFLVDLYRQKIEFAGVPTKGTDVSTALGAVSLGTNSAIDLFLTGSGYYMRGYSGTGPLAYVMVLFSRRLRLHGSTGNSIPWPRGNRIRFMSGRRMPGSSGKRSCPTGRDEPSRTGSRMSWERDWKISSGW